MFNVTKKDNLSIPTLVAKAINNHFWKSTMEEEMTALSNNKIWKLVPYHPEMNLVGNKWVYKIKTNADGSFQRCKARLVAKGFHQTPEINFHQTFNPVIKVSTLRVILILAVSNGWRIKQLDVNNTFLNEELKETVCMKQSKGFEDSIHPNHVCQLNKALYGLKQTPRAWFNKLKSTLLKWGFKNSQADTSFFFLVIEAIKIFIIIYVDDIIMTGNKPERMRRFIIQLSILFALNDLGELHLFLIIEAKHDEIGLFLAQIKYTEELLKRNNMHSSKPCSTPAVVGSNLSAEEGHELSDLIP